MKRLGKFKMLAISAVVLVASIAVAQSVKTNGGNGQRGAWMKHGFHGRGGAFLNRLNLTDDQKAKIKAFRASFLESNKPLFEQVQAKRQELRQASEGGTFNEALATQKLTEMAVLQAKLMGERFKLRQEMQSVLTAEQRAQLEQFKAHRGERRGAGGPRDDE